MEDMFETSLGKFYLGDARVLIRNIANNSIDCIVTDPPWGVKKGEYDDEDVFYEILPELYRVLKVGGALAVFYAVKKLDRLMIEVSKIGFKYYWMIIRLDLTRTAGRSPFGFSNYAPIVIFYKEKPAKVRYRLTDVLPFGEIDYDLVKELVENTPLVYSQLFKSTLITTFLVQTLTKKGELVLDPFGGCGSVPYVCEVHGRRWISFEIDRKKFEIAKSIILYRKVPKIE